MIISGKRIMKRVYQKEAKSKLYKQAMEQYLKTRAIIKRDHPNLLREIQQKLFGPNKQSDIEAIDRAKNVQTVEKLLACNTSSAVFQKKIEAMLTNTRL